MPEDFEEWVKKETEKQTFEENSGLATLADALVIAREKKDAAKAAETEANKEIERLEPRLHELMVAHELESFKHNGHGFTPYVDSFPRPTDKDKFLAWCQEHDEMGIWKWDVHPQTLRSWYKENGEKYAEKLVDVLTVYEKIKIRIRKA